MMNVVKTPIALFTYNRPKHAQLALASIARCARLDDCILYIYCDGPKDSTQIEKVAASRRVAQQWAAQLNAEVIERSENLGLARSIVTGVTALCQKYGRVIVVEDDMIVSPDFLHYMLEALDRYQDYPEVYQISAYMFQVEHPNSPDAFFLPLTTTRGWATWQRAWHIFDWNATGYHELMADAQTRQRFNLENSYPYYDMLAQKLAGQNDSWGILWWYAVFKVGGLVLHPRRSLVWMGGFDGSGTHSGSYFRQPHVKFFERSRLSQPLIFPNNIGVNEAAFNRVKRALPGEMGHQWLSFISKVKQKLGRHLFWLLF
jgi:GT2 family glycosyltransferase